MPSIEELLERESEAWKPQPGDSLIGTVVSVTEFQGDFSPYPIVEIDDRDGKPWAWHAYHSVAKNEIAKLAPKPGDEIGVKYNGKVKTKPGSKYDSYESYKIKINRTTGEVPDAPDWEAMQRETQADVDALSPATAPAVESDPFAE